MIFKNCNNPFGGGCIAQRVWSALVNFGKVARKFAASFPPIHQLPGQFQVRSNACPIGKPNGLSLQNHLGQIRT
jgi:hypothetical protein